jgi:hypothetical protein
MPNVAVLSLGIQLRSGVNAGVLRIKTAVNDVLAEVVKTWVKIMARWIMVKVPERTGRMMRDMLANLYQSTANALKIGTTNTSYASYVNQMTGVNWTKPTSVEHFYREAQRFGMQILPRVVVQAIRTVGLDVRMNMTADAVARTMFT